MVTYLFFFSEDEAMDVDSTDIPKSNEDDLSQYNLEEYDDDVQTTSKSYFSYLSSYY